jgi:CyaY protein
MDEREFDSLAAKTMSAIEKALESCDPSLDFELRPGGVIELDFDDGSKIIVNSHRAAREIWLAARSGGYHFKLQDGRWVGTRDGADLAQSLSRCIAEQSGTPVKLTF